MSDAPGLLRLLEGAPAAIAIQRGPELRYELANARYCQLLGGRPLVGRSLAEALPDWAQLRRIVESVAREGKAFVASDYRFLVDPDGDGNLRDAWFDLICQPLGEPGALHGVLTFGVEVTQQVEVRQRLEATAAELRRAVEERDEFLSVASHELKTPLTALRLQVQSLQRSARRGADGRYSPDEVRTKLDGAERQVERLVELVDALLDVSRLQSGALDLAASDVDLLEVARDVIERARIAAGDAGSMIALESAETAPIVGHWDRSRVDQVLTNLMSNAIKYGGGNPIVVRVALEQGRAQVSVTDGGIGIAPADQARIFQRFERAVSRTEFAGLGLGLWISRRIAESLGGSVTVESTLGQGSRFTFALPL